MKAGTNIIEIGTAQTPDKTADSPRPLGFALGNVVIRIAHDIKLSPSS